MSEMQANSSLFQGCLCWGVSSLLFLSSSSSSIALQLGSSLGFSQDFLPFIPVHRHIPPFFHSKFFYVLHYTILLSKPWASNSSFPIHFILQDPLRSFTLFHSPHMSCPPQSGDPNRVYYIRKFIHVVQLIISSHSPSDILYRELPSLYHSF